jgi:Flp pilus assembly protein TadD
LARQENFKDALGHFSEALRINPDHAGARYNLAILLQNLSKARARGLGPRKRMGGP